ENSKVFVTFTSNTGTTTWHVSDKKARDGFAVSLNAPLQQDVSFDYFVVSVNGAPSGNAQNGTSTPPTSIDTTAPSISINGNNPATISVGTTYADLGARITSLGDDKYGIHIFVNGVEMSTVQIDTSVAGNHTIQYKVTDEAGNTGVAERRVIVESQSLPTPTGGTETENTTPDDTASSTPNGV
ncbi:DUF5011 domain-containing protein, partial [Patescibacteria group bacterium]